MINIYNSLHVHSTEGSIGDSILKIKDALKKAESLGMTAIAITDHGSVSNLFKLYKASIDKDINTNVKPIYGIETYEAHDRKNRSQRENFHLILLAKNNQGFLDMLQISSDSSLNGFYYKPRTDMSILKKYGSNIIGMSACVGGRIPSIIKEIYSIEEDTNIKLNEKEKLIKLKEDKVINLIEDYKSCFAEFYLELQPGNFHLQIYVNNYLVKLSKITNTPLVITNDVHYLNADDYMAHNYHVKLNKDTKSDILDKDTLEYPDRCYYLMGYNDIKNRFDYIDNKIIEEALNNTIRISDSITTNLGELYNGTIKMPKADTNNNRTEYEELYYMTLKGFKNKILEFADPVVYIDRLYYELETLNEVGFCGYLLIIKDLIDYANENNIPIGPGRGSISGSLVAYLIGITKVDSIKYNLMFERFISRFRKGSVPDVDLDSSSSHRPLLFKYITNKYGIENCAMVSTIGMRKAKGSIQDAARLLGINRQEAIRVSKLIPIVYYREDEEDKETDLGLKRSYEVDSKFRAEMDKNPEWFAIAKMIEGYPKSAGVHPAGTLISPIALNSYLPLIRNSSSTNKEPMLDVATSFNLKDAESCGGIKYDILSIVTLDIINKTELEVGYKPNFSDDNWYNDNKVWDIIGSVHTITLFQIGSRIYKERMYRLKPKNIEELSHCLALVRGPCINSKLDKQYIDVLEGKNSIQCIHPFYDDITHETNGVLLYQEQVIDILINFGFTSESAFKIMKKATKKDEEYMAEHEVDFMGLAEKNKVPVGAAKKIWKIIYDTYKYSFNKSHGCAYAMLTFYSAYLRVYYPLQWFKNALTNAYERVEEIQETINECRSIGIKFLPVDINKSKYEFTVEDDKIRFGFVAIKGVGLKAYSSINANRPYNSVEDFINHNFEAIENNSDNDDKLELEAESTEENTKYNKTHIVNSILCGALECFNESRVNTIKKYIKLKKEMSLDENILIISPRNHKDINNIQKIEEDILRTTALSTPANGFKEFYFDSVPDKGKLGIEAIILKVTSKLDSNNKDMFNLVLDTYCGHINAVVFHSDYNKLSDIINTNLNKELYIEGIKNKQFNNIQIKKIYIF